MEVYLEDKTGALSDNTKDLLRRLLLFAAEQEKVASRAEVSLTFVTNEEIRVLNRDYRNKDRETDVISFALEESTEEELAIMDDDLPLVLGDIIVSVEKAKEQALEYNHSFEREIGFLVVHGFLHLLGYDHMHEEDEKVMFQRQEEILGEFHLER